MLKLGVLVSGGGTNLQAIIDSILSGFLKDVEISLVLSSNPNAKALERAKNYGIPTAVAARPSYSSEDDYERAIINLLQENKCELIITAGYMVILPNKFIDTFENRIINVHPSLIPSFCGQGFYGLKVHEAALKKGVKIAGATVHFVNRVIDDGPIILQKAVKVLPDDTPEALQQRVLKEAEWKILPEAIRLFSQNKLKIEGDIVRRL